ncbi:MAG: M20/M25/M40 family metallo-hydrolase [Sulfolobales archaeon]
MSERRESSQDLEVLKNRIFRYVDENHGRYIKLLEDLVSIPTVSAWGGESMREGAEYVASILRERGFSVDIVSGGGHPAVLAEIGRGSRSILIYNHYDVQPPDPLELWSYDPFKLSIKNEYLIGRGVADNKGNIVARILAVDSLYPLLDELDLRIKFFIEGEEEIGSPTLEKIIDLRREWIRADGGFWETGYVRRDGRLGISLGFKGMLYVEIILRGALRDIHSGYAPLIPNPVWRMAKLLQNLKDENGRVLIPGFYDDIDKEFLEISERILEDLDFEELDSLKKELNLRSFVRGLEGLEALRELYTKPSLNVSGLYAGYTGKGSKTIVPSVAGVKIDIRLVPGQDPVRILERLRRYLDQLEFSDSEIIVHGSYPSGYTRPDEKIVRTSVKAGEEVYGRAPVITPLSGGSGPIYLFTNIARIPMTGAGVGYFGSRVHAPDENIRLDDFIKSAKHVAYTLILFSRSF